MLNLVPISMDSLWLNIWNDDFRYFLSEAVADGNPEPCRNATRIAWATAEEKPLDKLCEALRSNDLDRTRLSSCSSISRLK